MTGNHFSETKRYMQLNVMQVCKNTIVDTDSLLNVEK
jgi:hypothetical protein